MARKESAERRTKGQSATLCCLPRSLSVASPNRPFHCSKLVQKLSNVARKGWTKLSKWRMMMLVVGGWYNFISSHHQRSLIFSDLINECKLYSPLDGIYLGPSYGWYVNVLSLPHCQHYATERVCLGGYDKHTEASLYVWLMRSFFLVAGVNPF